VNTRKTPRDLAMDLFYRSSCSVQMAAVITDKNGRIFSWGWNSVGNGEGKHAEDHAIGRANRKRLSGATITVAGRRVKTGKFVFSCPCKRCAEIIKSRGIKNVNFITKNGEWKTFKLR